MPDLSAHGEDPPAERSEPGGLRGRREPRLTEARRRVKRRRITLLVVVLGLVLVAGVALAYHAPPWLVEAPEPPRGLQALGLVLVVVGLVAAVVGLVRARRAKALTLAWNSPTAALSRVERKRLLRLIRTDGAVPPADQQDAVGLAEQLLRQGALLPAYGGMMVYFVGESLVTSSLLTRWSVAAALVLFGVGLPLIARDCRRARTWLDHHRPAGA